jgi:ubiquinone/menaquinone biosynthesis C-methylase UbiE
MSKKLDFIESESFDFIISFMALIDIEDYKGAIIQASRVQKLGGRFVRSRVQEAFPKISLFYISTCACACTVSFHGVSSRRMILSIIYNLHLVTNGRNKLKQRTPR